jgi:serine/threonine protein kinase
MQEIYALNTRIDDTPIGPIVIGKPLGSGAFGKVYAAIDEWGNALAVKVLLPRDNFLDRWIRECANLNALRHPNIVYIHCSFIHKGYCHIVMEKCAGTLASIFENGNISPPYLLPVARCILQGVDFMHKHNYVHKDLHAHNIFWAIPRNELVHFSAPGGTTTANSYTFKIGDLGVSKLITEIDIFKATLAPWMLPPEALRPDLFGVIGPQVDIYHSALLFLSILTRAIPSFTNEEIIAGVPRETATALGGPYGPVLERALRRTVSARTQSALQLWKELKEAVPPITLLPRA